MGALLKLEIQEYSNTDGQKRCGIRTVFTGFNLWAWSKNTVVLGVHNCSVYWECIVLQIFGVTLVCEAELTESLPRGCSALPSPRAWIHFKSQLLGSIELFVCSQTIRDFFPKLNSTLSLSSLELFSIFQLTEIQFLKYIYKSLCLAQNTDLGFYSIYALQRSSLLLCKVFLDISFFI